MRLERGAKRYRLSHTLLLPLALLIVATAPMATSGRVNEEVLSGLVWRDPGDVTKLDLIYGAGGKQNAPDAQGQYTFVKEDMDGTAPKFDVKDAHGVEWKVKLGAEPQSETAATRLLWAAGYFVDEDYYLPDFKVEGMQKLHRNADKWITDNGTVHSARLERRVKEVKSLGNWSWFDNTCGPAQPFNGLRVMMALVNNWDLKEVNNTVQEINGERRCVITDLGATFGRTGNVFGRSKSDVEDYAGSKFVDKVNGDSVDFVMHNRPFFAVAVARDTYRTRTRMEEITKNIPRADARWLGHLLAPLSPEQIRDCFRAAGYTPEEVDSYTQILQTRIAELNAL